MKKEKALRIKMAKRAGEAQKKAAPIPTAVSYHALTVTTRDAITNADITSSLVHVSFPPGQPLPICLYAPPPALPAVVAPVEPITTNDDDEKKADAPIIVDNPSLFSSDHYSAYSPLFTTMHAPTIPTRPRTRLCSIAGCGRVRAYTCAITDQPLCHRQQCYDAAIRMKDSLKLTLTRHSVTSTAAAIPMAVPMVTVA